jgi:hypothetical protein
MAKDGFAQVQRQLETITLELKTVNDPEHRRTLLREMSRLLAETERQDSNIAYNYAFVSGYTGIAQNLNLRGATLTLQLPNGDMAVVNCASKFQERFAGPGNVRSCRVPLVDSFEADFNGDKAKLMWPVSLDGKKTASETYKIIAVFKGKYGKAA